MSLASDELLSAVEGSLQRSGAYHRIKSQIRAQVYHAVEDKGTALPDKPADVFLVAELLRDFLIKFKLNNTLSVFCEEMGQPDEMRVDRELIAEELGLSTAGSDENMPLLLLLTQHLKAQRREFLGQICSSMSVADSQQAADDGQAPQPCVMR